jgi:predicted O-methyltransferase YrrM
VDPLVARAYEAAERLGFGNSSIPEVGRLLRVVAASRPSGRLAEIGTGTGVGAAAIAGGLVGGATLVTVETDAARAAAAAELFADRPDVRVVHGDWHDVLPREAPFDVVFFDGGGWKARPFEEGPRVLELVPAGGLVVIDDLTPDWPGPDPVRTFWLETAPVEAVEILTTPATAAILAVRR